MIFFLQAISWFSRLRSNCGSDGEQPFIRVSIVADWVLINVWLDLFVSPENGIRPDRSGLKNQDQPSSAFARRCSRYFMLLVSMV